MQTTRAAVSRVAGRAAAAVGAASAPTTVAHARVEVVAPSDAAGSRTDKAVNPAPPGGDARTADEWAHVTRDDVVAVVDAVTARLAPPHRGYGSLDAEADTDTDDDGWTRPGALAVPRPPPPPTAAAADPRVAFRETLTALLMDARVRDACRAALARDPNFRVLVDAAAGGAVIELDSLLPPAAAAAAAAAGDPHNPLGDTAPAVAAALDAMAHRLARHARAAAELLADLGGAVLRAVEGPVRATGVPRAARAAARAARDVDWADFVTVVAMASMAVLMIVRGAPPPPPRRV